MAAADPEVQGMLDYLNESWTAYHAVASAKTRLLAAGFAEISERDAWHLQPGEHARKRQRACAPPNLRSNTVACRTSACLGAKYQVAGTFTPAT